MAAESKRCSALIAVAFKSPYHKVGAEMATAAGRICQLRNRRIFLTHFFFRETRDSVLQHRKEPVPSLDFVHLHPHMFCWAGKDDVDGMLPNHDSFLFYQLCARKNMRTKSAGKRHVVAGEREK